MRRIDNKMLYVILTTLSFILLLIIFWYILFFTDLAPKYFSTDYIRLSKVFITFDLILVFFAGFATYGLWYDKSWGTISALIIGACWLYSFVCLFTAGMLIESTTIYNIYYTGIPILPVVLFFLFREKKDSSN